MRLRLLLLSLASTFAITAAATTASAQPAALTAAAAGSTASTPADTLPRSVPVRSAQQLRADLHNSMALSDIPDLSADELVTMSRLLAVDDLSANITSYYGTDYLWSLAMMMAVSNLDPTAQGPLVDDRGLGQIGFQVEQTARDWGTDPTSPYYSANLAKDGSIWDPNVNMHAQAIWFRNVLTFNYLTTIDQAAAIYARGLSAVDPATGGISSQAQSDVQRAKNAMPVLQKLLFLKDFVRRQDSVPDSLSPIAHQILEIDRTTADGAPSYAAFRDLYVGLVYAGPPNPYLLSAYLHEAVIYTGILDRGYHLDEKAAARQIQALMDGLRATMSRQGYLADRFDQDYDTISRIAAAQ